MYIDIYVFSDSYAGNIYLNEDDAVKEAKDFAAAVECRWEEVSDVISCKSFEEVESALLRGDNWTTDRDILSDILRDFQPLREKAEERYYEEDDFDLKAEEAKLFQELGKIIEQFASIKTCGIDHSTLSNKLTAMGYQKYSTEFVNAYKLVNENPLVESAFNSGVIRSREDLEGLVRASNNSAGIKKQRRL